MSTSVARIVGRLPVHVKRASLRALPNFPTRMRNAIVRAGIGETIGDLEALGDKELMALQNVGAVSLAALLEYLERLAAGAPVAERLALEGIPDPTAAVPKPELRSGPPAVSTFRAALEAAIYVARFNERHRRMHICALRLGLDRSVCTLAEIGDRCGITRERVRQVVGKTLERLATYPLAAAFRAVVSAVLAEREAVTIRELTGLSGWLGGISEAGMRVVLEAFVPAVETYYSECARAWLVTARPRADIERALQGVLVRVDAVRRFDRASAAIESVAVRAAGEAGLPRIAATLAGIARAHVDRARYTCTDFVHEYVEQSREPVALSAVLVAATERGFADLAPDHIRNMLATSPGVFPLGRKTFGSFRQIFPVLRPELDSVAALAVHIAERQPARQFHAYDLWKDVCGRMPAEASLVGDFYRLAALLRARTALRYLGRLVFVGSEHGERIELIPLARRVLEESGAPLPVATLAERMRAQRGFHPSSLQAVRPHFIEVQRGIWGLPGRDERRSSSNNAP